MNNSNNGKLQQQNFEFVLNNILDRQCVQFYNDFSSLFVTAKGSNIKHQAWPGGYIDHLDECFALAKTWYEGFISLRDTSLFSLKDALTVLFLHDTEKLFKYGTENKTRMPDTYNQYKHLAETNPKELIQTIIEHYNIFVSPEMQNALKYVHGEGKDYSKTENVALPLAAFVHNIDYFSARAWHNEPQKTGLLPCVFKKVNA